MRRLAALLLLAGLAAGCAGPRAPAVLHFGVEDAPEGKRVLFPPAPEVPRFMYAGQLTGEENFRRGEEGRGARDFLHWLVGLVAGEDAPVVLQRPVAGAVGPDGRIYVTDVSRQAVFVFDQQAGELLVWDRADARRSFSAPAGIALGPGGEVFVADADLALVVRLDATGEPKGTIGRGELRRPTGLAWDAGRGRLLVADAHDHDIKEYDAAGRLLRRIGGRGEGAGEFNFPSHIAVAGDELYVTDSMNSRVQVLGLEDGRPRRVIGRRGLYVGDLVRPKGIAADDEGNVYVVESYYDHLLVFDRQGQFLMPIGGTGAATGRFYLPTGVWTDSGSRVFVADMFNGRVVVFQFLGGDGERAN